MTEPLRQLPQGAVDFRRPDGPSLHTVTTSPVPIQGESTDVHPEDSLRTYLGPTLTPDIAVAIELFDEIPRLTLIQRQALLAYYLWETSSSGNFEKIASIMGKNVARKANALVDAVLNDQELGEKYEAVDAAITGARRVTNKTHGEDSARRLLHIAQVIRQRGYNEDDVEGMGGEDAKEINEEGHRLMIEEIKEESGITPDMSIEELKEAARRILLTGEASVIAEEATGLHRGYVASIKGHLIDQGLLKRDREPKKPKDFVRAAELGLEPR